MTREEAIKVMFYVKNHFWNDTEVYTALDMAIEALSDVPDTNVEKWIPVSERLPEENMWTICQNNAGAMMIGKYDIEFGWMFPVYFDGIVAWMPLPEPFMLCDKQ